MGGGDTAKSNTEIQRDYRQRRPQAGDNGDRRINTWITISAALALRRLARHNGGSQREMLERMILEEDGTIMGTLPADPPELDGYLTQ